MHDRYALDPPCLHHVGNLAQGSEFADADDLAGHDVRDPLGVRLDVFGGQSGIWREPLAPAQVPALGAGFGPAQQVAFGDDPDDLPIRVYDWNAADAIVDHELCLILDGHLRRCRHDLAGHYIDRSHAILLSAVHKVSLRNGSAIDLAQDISAQ